MKKHIFLMFNMGNSGGKWFEDICNIHEDVRVWVEANHLLGVASLDNAIQFDAVCDFFMGQYQTRKEKTIGLIKAFDIRLIKFAEENGGTFLQMFRHPIGVVGFKNGHKINECKQRGLFKELDTPEKVFEAHVEFYASVYQKYIDNAFKWPVVKLEDLKKSLREGTPYFAEIMKRSLKVDWKEEHTQKVITMGDLDADLSHFDIWESWDSFKKEIFLKYFKNIMEIYHYDWERAC